MPSNPYNKLNIYGKNQNAQVDSTGNSRETDARALLSCAGKLNSAKETLLGNPRSKESLKAYNDAIRTNQELWTIFQVALSDPENALPATLKVTLFRLSRFVDKTSFAAIGKFAPDLVDSLININRTIAAGLSKNPAKTSDIPVAATENDTAAPVVTSA